MKGALDGLSVSFASQPDDRELLGRLCALVALGEQLPFAADVWKTQNVYYRVLQQTAPTIYEEAANGDSLAQEWATLFAELGDRLRVRRD